MDAVGTRPLRVRQLGRQPYEPVWRAMQRFTDGRDAATVDELWVLQHDPVFTLGQAGKWEHVLLPGAIPVLPVDRGGQVTYHGPGQVVAYPLINLQRQGYFVREYVFRLEAAVIQTLEGLGITGHRVSGAPGIYVRLDDPGAHAALTGPAHPDDPFRGLGKVAALGIKVSRQCTYHGVALNVAMDLQPFAGINPCGYAGLRTVDLATLGVFTDWPTVAQRFGERLAAQLVR